MALRRKWGDRLTAWAPILFLAVFAAITYWLDQQILQGGPRSDGSARHDPDIFIERFAAINLDSTGRVTQALSAERAQHFPDDDSTEFDRPDVTFSTPGKPVLRVTSTTGRVTGDVKHAYFRGEVRAVRESAAGDPTPQGPVTLTTTFLHVLPSSHRAETDQRVTIADPRVIIEGVGMVLDSEKKTVQLRSKVQGELKPGR